LPHLVQAGRARVTLRLERADAAVVFGLAVSGKRWGEVAGVTKGDGTLTIPLAVDAAGKARMLYEVVIGE
jgi:hypothetical protein